MRVIAGTARGIELRRPRAGTTRPTAGRLRESWFAMLDAAGADLSRVLDLYAGSGALGIEALSRGGGVATFVEADRRAAAVIRENLRRTRLDEQAEVVVGRVERWRRGERDRYTLVVADPPYDGGDPWGAIVRAIDGALEPHAVVAVEHDARRSPPEELGGLRLWRDRRQGAGAVAVYRAEDWESVHPRARGTAPTSTPGWHPGPQPEPEASE